MRGLRRRLRALRGGTGFQGAVLTLLSGTAAGLALSYLAQPLLTRLYPPEAFGTLDFFVSVMGVLIPFASLRYEDAVMLPEDDDEAANVLWLAVLLMLGFVALTALLLPWRAAFAGLFGLPEAAGWLLLTPAALLLMRTARLAEMWLARQRRFPTISSGQVTRTVTMVGTRIGAGVPPGSAGAGGLIGGFVVGHAASSLLYLVALARSEGETLRRAFDLRRLRPLAVRYRRFPAFSLPSTLLNALLSNLPVLLLLYFFDETVVGFYGRAFMLLAVPLSVIGASIAKVFFAHAATAVRKGTLPDLTRRVHARLAALALLPTLLLVLAGPDLFAVVFGEDWRPAGTYVRYVGPWLALAAIASPLTNLFDVLERQRADLMVSAVMFTTQTAALVAGGLTGDLYVTLALLGGAGALVRLLHLGVMLRLAGVAWGTALAAYARYGAFALPALGLTAAALTLEASGWTFAAAALGGVLYAGLVLWRDRLLEPGT